MKAILSAWTARSFARLNLALWATSSLAAGYAGPFGTFNSMGALERFTFWAALIGFSLLIAGFLMTLREKYLPEWGTVPTELALSAIFTCLFGPTLFIILSFYEAPDPSPLNLFQTLMAVLLVSSVIAVARLVLFSFIDAQIHGANALDTPRLLGRLPDHDPGPVLRLSGKDHFVEVTTPSARYDIRMRLSDAIAEMDGVEGFLTHRSHWIAKEAIDCVERVQGRHYVVAADKSRIPVSRTHLPKLEEAGLA